MNPFVRVVWGQSPDVVSRLYECSSSLISISRYGMGGDCCKRLLPLHLGCSAVLEVGEISGKGPVPKVLDSYSNDCSGKPEHLAMVIGELQGVKGRSYRLRGTAVGGP
jgi:hypothetical protein